MSVRATTEARRGNVAVLGFEVDAGFVVQTDGKGEMVPISSASAPSATALIDGYYTVDSNNLTQWAP